MLENYARIVLVIGLLSIVDIVTCKNVLSMHVVYDAEDTLFKSVQHAVDFLTETHSAGSMCGNEMLCTLHLPSTAPDDLFFKLQDKPYIATEFISYDTIKDNGIGRRSQPQEHVTGQIASIKKTLQMVQDLRGDDKKHNILSLSFSATSYPVATPSLLKIFDFMKKRSVKNSEVILLEKCQSMSSISDWHDLMVLGLIVANSDGQNAPAWEWVRHLESTFKMHANAHRRAFNLLDPRPAILEATVQLLGRVNVSYFYPSMIDSFYGYREQTPPQLVAAVVSVPLHQQNRSTQLAPLMSLKCEGSARQQVSCLTIHHHPIAWTPSMLDIKSLTWQDKFGLPKQKKRQRSGGKDHKLEIKREFADIVSQFEVGPNRYRYTPYADKPTDFCWDSGSQEDEDFTTSRIYQGLFNSTPFTKPLEWTYLPRKLYVLLTGTELKQLDTYLYQTIGKTYYAARHGYKFVQKLSTQYAKYFGSKFLEDTPVGSLPYGVHVMAKIPMVLHAMYENPTVDWIFWTDADTWINPGWLDMPLDVYTADVPSSKLVILANFRSTFSNAFFIRNTMEGRQFARDWLAIAQSGYIQCHGYDQAALQTLILSRMHSAGRYTSPSATAGTSSFPQREKQQQATTPLTPIPFNYTCLSKRWLQGGGNKLPGNMKEELPGGMPDNWEWGCGTSSSWSCDFNFEQTLWRLGFESSSFKFHKNQVSSFSKGCANDYIPFVHIAAENRIRPRLHCEYCDLLSEIEASSRHYDGPLGGGNDWVRRDAVNGYFLNHKLQYPFYDAYSHSSTCKQNKEFIPLCGMRDLDILMGRLNGLNRLFSSAPKHNQKNRKPHTLISLVDGLAFDVERGRYCMGNDALYTYQKKNTYMKEYSAIIAASKKISEAKWNNSYINALKAKGHLEFRPRLKHYEVMFFEVANVCEKCKIQYSAEYMGGSLGNNSVLNCRRPYGA